MDSGIEMTAEEIADATKSRRSNTKQQQKQQRGGRRPFSGRRGLGRGQDNNDPPTTFAEQDDDDDDENGSNDVEMTPTRVKQVVTDKMDETMDKILPIDSAIRRQDTCFKRILFVSVLAVITFILVDLYGTPGEMDLAPEFATGGNGGDSGTLNEGPDQILHPGDLSHPSEKDSSMQGNLIDWVEKKGQVQQPEHISKDDPRYDYLYRHHDPKTEGKPGLRPNPIISGIPQPPNLGPPPDTTTTPIDDLLDQKKSWFQKQQEQFEPFNETAWHHSHVSVSDGVQYEIVQQLKHDKRAFLEGLTYYHGYLYESTGLERHSTIRKLDPDTGEIVESYPVPSSDVFGEGLTIIGRNSNKAIQLTYKKKLAYVYDVRDLSKGVQSTFHYETATGEGWGLTYWPGKHWLVVSDGSSYLLMWDADTYRPVSKVHVTRQDGTPVQNINELEFWHGSIMANIWYKDTIIAINPRTGVVEKEYDFSKLYPASQRSRDGADVLNGISRAKDPNLLYVTGKNWDRMFLVKPKF